MITLHQAVMIVDIVTFGSLTLAMIYLLVWSLKNENSRANDTQVEDRAGISQRSNDRIKNIRDQV